MAKGIQPDDARRCVGPGWHPLLDRIYAVLPDETFVTQVKEKYGGLRFYVSGAPMEVFDVIDQCEDESYTICEQCGKPGKTFEDRGWLRTLCEDCHANIQV